MKSMSLAEVEYLGFKLTREIMSFNEPIPDFSTRFPNVLESCLATPFQKLYKKDAYPTFLTKASILFYLMIKNHPFKNGNKRIAMTTLLVFFLKNKKWLKVDTYELYKFALWVAESPARLKDETVKAIEKFLKTYLLE